VRDNLGPLLEQATGPKTLVFSKNMQVFAEKTWVNDHNMTLLWSFYRFFRI
jgi:hypothetical protein